MKENEIRSYFDSIAEDFDSYYESPRGVADRMINEWLRRPGLVKRLQIALDFSDPVQGKRILDVGCGSGKFVVECAKKGAKVVGVDVSEEMVRLAENACRMNGVTAEFIVGDIHDLQLNGFDVCVCLGVVEYFQDPEPLIRKIFHAVVPGGRIVMSVPSLLAPQTPLRAAFLFRRGVHCYFFTKRQMKEICLAHGTEPRSVKFASYGPGFVFMGEKQA